MLGAVSWSGSVAVEPGRLTVTGRIGPTAAHAHAAVQIVLVSSGTLGLTNAAGTRTTADAAVIPAGARHAMDVDNAHGLMIYIEAASTEGRALSGLFEGDTSRVDSWVHTALPLSGFASAAAGKDPHETADAALRALTDTAARSQRPTDCHPSVRHAIELLPDLINGPVRRGEVATRVGLSPDRLGRLFARDLGLSFPAYVRWIRLMRAIDEVRRGATFTDAAHAAGFTDSSHANRVFHEMFGLTPLHAARGLRWA